MTDTDTTLALVKPGEMMRQATDVAGACREIVKKTAINIKGRQYIKVEGWQSIATAHGCVAGARDVEKIEGGIRAVGEIRRIDNGMLIATAEGFVGNDERTWASRDEYAKRAMAQTRAISRACRSAFAHVVVLIDEKMSTTPAEEVPENGFVDHHSTAGTRQAKTTPAEAREVNTMHEKPAASDGWEEETTGPQSWRDVPIHFGYNKGKTLGEVASGGPKVMEYWTHTWLVNKSKPNPKFPLSAEDERLMEAISDYIEEQERDRNYAAELTDRARTEKADADVESDSIPIEELADDWKPTIGNEPATL